LIVPVFRDEKRNLSVSSTPDLDCDLLVPKLIEDTRLLFNK
jgi:hypothetical protein